MDGYEVDLRQLFLESEPLLLFSVIGLGYIIGQIKIRGFSLGIAAVLFVGLLFGGWRSPDAPPLTIAREISEVGLILFVYVVGLTSGAGFFSSFRKRGIRFNTAVFIALLIGTLITFIGGWLLSLPFGQISGVFCGGLTNTPALAAVTEIVKHTEGANPSDPAVGYSVAYPYGVIGGILAFHIFFNIFGKRPEKRAAREEVVSEEETSDLIAKNFEVRNPDLFNRPIGELGVREKTGVIISRVRHGDKVIVPTKYTILHEGDIVVTVGTLRDIDKARDYFGSESSEHPELSKESIDIFRILMSRRDLVGRKIEELELDRKFNAQITRIRRADIEIVPYPEMALEIGDRLMIVMPVERAGEVTKFFGDSVRGLSELDYTALTLGITMGVLLGMIRVSLPGGNTISLGFAGGPLLVGLILGRLSRTGPLLWSIPLESSQTLSHIGLLFFLAGVGVRAGGDFFSALSTTGGKLFVLGIMTTTVTTILTLLLLRFYAHANAIQALGATSGMQTQPATLACAYDITKSYETYIGYATTYPVAMISKILLAQLIFIFGQNMFG